MPRSPVQRALLAALLLSLFPILVPTSAGAQSFLGLPAGTARHKGFWEGKTDYGFALRPSGKIRRRSAASSRSTMLSTTTASCWTTKEAHVRIEIVGRTGKSFRLRVTR